MSMRIHISLWTLAGVLLALTAQAAPKIAVLKNEFSFGKIPQHGVANHRFWIKSVGGTKVKITKAIPDCGCTTLVLKDSTIAPGDSIPIDVIFHSRAFIGYIVKEPAIEIEGSSEKSYVRFTAEVVMDPARTTPLVITPFKVDVSQFTEKPRRRGTFTLTNPTPHDYTISIIDSTLKSFEVKLPSVIKGGQSVVGEILVKKPLVNTSFEEAFTFEINDEGHSHYTVPIQRMYNPTNDPAMSLSRD